MGCINFIKDILIKTRTLYNDMYLVRLIKFTCKSWVHTRRKQAAGMKVNGSIIKANVRDRNTKMNDDIDKVYILMKIN